MTTTMDARTDDLISRLAAHLHQTEIPDIAPDGHEHEATFALLLEEWGREFCLGYDPYQIVEALARRAVEFVRAEGEQP